MATLIGCGSHAADIMHAAVKYGQWERSLRRVCHHSEWDGEGAVMLGMNNPQTRAQIAAELNVQDLSWVHPAIGWMGKDVTWEYGTHINYAVSMTRTTLGHHVTISPGVTICGDVTIGDRVLIGAGATICDRVTIGDDVTIGAGAVVLPESVVDDGATIVGIPAKHLATGVHVK
jgi:carbonic anhydrase/acetyltransferase-like protein (isoleucine patch superfamily)